MTRHDETAKTKPSGMNRRRFLARGGLAVGARSLAPASLVAPAMPAGRPSPVGWEAVRGEFALAPDLIQMAGFFLASHPRPVREAIERHRRGLDADPIGYYREHNDRLVAAVLRAAAEYLGAEARDVALTDSTTMGLGLLYGGLTLRPGQEILTTRHDHYATSASLRLRAERTGATVRSIALYDDPATASRAGIVAALAAAVGPRTRVVAVTWVHSGTGVKLPVQELADALVGINAGRAEGERALLCVDGVHGLGVEDVSVADLGCDFFVAGCHKWLFGPRGSGLIWGDPAAWPATAATIPTFDAGAYASLGDGEPSLAAAMTPGGFHSFEHRWALEAAFRFHLGIGKAAVAERVHGLNRRLKEGLAGLRHVRLRTPVADELSAGIVCFEVDGRSPEAVVAGLRERRIVSSVTPYATRYARLAPGLLTSADEVEETLSAVRGLAGSSPRLRPQARPTAPPSSRGTEDPSPARPRVPSCFGMTPPPSTTAFDRHPSERLSEKRSVAEDGALGGARSPTAPATGGAWRRLPRRARLCPSGDTAFPATSWAQTRGAAIHPARAPGAPSTMLGRAPW